MSHEVSCNESKAMQEADAKTLWQEVNTLKERQGTFQERQGVVEYQIKQLREDAKADRLETRNQYIQLLGEIKTIGHTVHGNEVQHAEIRGAEKWRRYAIGLAITLVSVGIAGATLLLKV